MRLPPGYTLVSLDAVDSTNEEARRRIAAGAPHGTVIRARRQRRGRGRRGRRWASPPGNLYATIVLRPPPVPALGQLAFVAALGAGDALRPLAPVVFKWPNDLLLGDAKLGGILIEVFDRAVAVGVGVNVARAPSGPGFAAARLPAPVRAPDLIGPICRCFDAWYERWRREGFAPVRAAWLAHAAGLDRPVEARLPGTVASGLFRGLDEDGGLILERPDGGRQVVAAGDVLLGAG